MNTVSILNIYITDSAMGFWHIIDNIYLADKQGASNENNLKDNKIQKVINLAGSSYDNLFYGIEYLNCKLKDKSDEKLPIKESINFFEDDKNILVHCVGAFSRSPAIICAILIKKYKYRLTEAIELLQSKRKQVSINTGFYDQLNRYQKKASGGMLKD